MPWTPRLRAVAALLALSVPAQAQVVAPTEGTVPLQPPGETVLVPGSDRVEAFECRSLLTLLRVAIPPWERARPWILEPFERRTPDPAMVSARQRCFDVLAVPVVRFEAEAAGTRRTAPAGGPGM